MPCCVIWKALKSVSSKRGRPLMRGAGTQAHENPDGVAVREALWSAAPRCRLEAYQSGVEPPRCKSCGRIFGTASHARGAHPSA